MAAVLRGRARGVAFLSVAAILVAAGLVALLSRSAHAAFPGRNGKIALYREQPPTGSFVDQIYTIEPNGTHQRRLTEKGSNADPSYSPNGKRIAFDSDRDGDAEIFTMKASGRSERRVTKNVDDADFDPAWSPSGRRIAFTHSHLGHGEIYTMTADGSHQHARTSLDANTFGAAWSPNGKRIAFYSDDDGDFDVYTIAADGTGLKQLTHNSGFDGEPDYSPNGRRIVFATGDGIFRMNAGGGGRKQLTSKVDSAPAYSPNGRKIAFLRTVAGNDEVFTMNADGTKQVRRTTNARTDLGPDWQPLQRHHRHHHHH